MAINRMDTTAGTGRRKLTKRERLIMFITALTLSGDCSTIILILFW